MDKLQVINEMTADDARLLPESVRAAILALPANYRAVIELRHFQEMSYDEIASALSIPLSDVKSHLFRARKLLAEKIGHEFH